MRDPYAYDDEGAGALIARQGFRVIPVPRPLRVVLGGGLLALGVGLGGFFLPFAVLLFAQWVAPGERTRSAVWWLTPALLRAAEYGFVLAVAARFGGGGGPSALPAAYGLLAALSFHHYDLVYRIRYAGLAPPGWLSVAGGGYEVRMMIVALLAVAGATALQWGLAALAVVLAALFVAESVSALRSWLAGQQPGRGGVT
jgi:hypothetical protein